MAVFIQVLLSISHELMLFAAFAFVLGGTSDTAVDLIWAARATWRRGFIFKRFTRATAISLEPSVKPERLAVFIPAWDESTVIGAMLRHAIDALAPADCVIYVGVYPNDPATIAAVAAVASPRVRPVIGPRPGPTTKADCLNILWQQMQADDLVDGVRTKAVVLHDAEDVVHASEARVFDCLTDRFDLVQLPVVPLVDPASRWISGHYIDEFAVHHGKTIVAREWIGAGLPSAGVGCAFSRTMLDRIAQGRDGPFDAASLTEDYELGLRIRQLGGRGAFVRLPESPGGPLVCVRAHFPAELADAVVQKSRWIAGIALSGWDRLGWQGGFAESWMRLNDRRALFAAIVMLAAYGALATYAIATLLGAALGIESSLRSSWLFDILLLLCGVLLLWRLTLRGVLVTQLYGWREGLRSIPRSFFANVIDMMAARRAVEVYLKARRDGVVRWDKTRHAFPADPGTAR
ncbi:glycosyl transferase family protein [Sphingomonas sp. SUN039]|uniref:glycosyl transferase family protein n=1 Tax=Sphingomonas sp. SUN039 TaxID=2937787 RepID=UPI0021640E39|nr:glycosyl transferase family protein [Sphingomonas sp. SUN039]UVO54661.1 glycosyl transferase family protein [Sphingomonas sp. SUN039]